MRLIVEAQIMGNRMEAGLEDRKDLVWINAWHELRAKEAELCRECADITGRNSEDI